MVLFVLIRTLLLHISPPLVSNEADQPSEKSRRKTGLVFVARLANHLRVEIKGFQEFRFPPIYRGG
jgi:hypothetical protein